MTTQPCRGDDPPPRHRPKHAAPPAAPRAPRVRAAAAAGTAPRRAHHHVSFVPPGLRAWAATHPSRARRAAVVTIAGGVALFVAASVGAAARPSTPHRLPLAADTGSARPLFIPAAVLPSGAPDTSASSAPTVAVRALDAHRVVSQRTAPASATFISGLASNGIPSVALNAYRVAAARMAHVDPSCGIDWALLAGIGREESDHGRFGGAVLHTDGTSTPRIIGPALDGVHWDYVPAPADGLALDGDATYAHALGPMQFIPQTWAVYGADADGNGTADVFDIDDAALGAARYLCAAGGDLTTRGGQIAAIMAYNHNDTYLTQVLALADAYRRGITVTGIPQGNTTGGLPAIVGGASPYGVNPGPPAVDRTVPAAPGAPAVGGGGSAGTGRTGTRTGVGGSGSSGTTGTGGRTGSGGSGSAGTGTGTGTKGGGGSGSGGSGSGGSGSGGSGSGGSGSGGGKGSGGSSTVTPTPTTTTTTTTAPTTAPTTTVPVTVPVTTTAPAPSPTTTCKLGLGPICLMG